MAGLFDFLKPQAQMPGQASGGGLRGLLAPEIMLPIAAQLMGQQGNQQNFANALGAAGTGIGQRKKDNQTVAFLVKEYGMTPDDAMALMGNPPVLAHYLKKREAQMPGQEEYFGSPLFTEDEQGNIIPNQLSNRGGLKPIDLGGNKLASPTKEVDTGTEIITYDRFGKELFRQPKQNYQEKYDQAAGTSAGGAAGDAAGLYQSLTSKMPGLESVVVKLEELSDKATYTAGGKLYDDIAKQTGFEPREAAVARAEYIAMVDNQVLPLLRDTFGAAFTQKEGETLRATLGDPNKSPQEKKAVLRAFIEQKRRDLGALAQESGRGTSTPQRRKYNPATGRIE